MITNKQFLKWITQRNEEETCERIGEDLGVSRVAVFRWLRGERNPTQTVLKLAERVMQEKR